MNHLKTPPAAPASPAPCPTPSRPAEPSLDELIQAIDRRTLWPTFRLRCALRQPA